MDIKHPFLAAIAGGNNEGLAVLHEANVTEKAFVEDGCDRREIMLAAGGIPVELGAAGFEVHGKDSGWLKLMLPKVWMPLDSSIDACVFREAIPAPFTSASCRLIVPAIT